MGRVQDRRRHSRLPLGATVTLRGPEGTLEGVAENMSYSGILVKSNGELPDMQIEYEVTLAVALGSVRAHGTVVRVEPDAGRFAMELTRVENNGHLLLAMLIAPPAGARSA